MAGWPHPSRSFAPRAMNTRHGEKLRLVLGAGNGQVPAITIALLTDPFDPAVNTEPQQ